MKVIQYLMVVVIIAAGIVGVGLALELIPVTQGVLPTWASDLLPSIGTARAGWLIFAVVAVLVIAALVHGLADRAMRRRDGAAGDAG